MQRQTGSQVGRGDGNAAAAISVVVAVGNARGAKPGNRHIGEIVVDLRRRRGDGQADGAVLVDIVGRRRSRQRRWIGHRIGS